MTTSVPVRTLRDVILKISLLEPSPQRDELLEIADHLKSYFNKPTHEIPMAGIMPRLRYIELYWWFLRLPKAEIDQNLHALHALLDMDRHMSIEMGDASLQSINPAANVEDQSAHVWTP